MKIAATYIRVSDDRQTEYSPDSQLKLVRKFAKEHGYYIPDEYVFQDDGISAKSADKRLEFNRMISIAKDKSRPFEAILVWKFSRFARNQEESIVFKSLLAKNGVSVISISEPIVAGPFGSLIERIIEWFDAFYLINLSGEVRRGMIEKASRGEAMCAPCFGYDLDSKNKVYVPNADADIVREVFRRFAAGETIMSITRSLGARGVRTSRGNVPDNRWVEYMLRNPVYIGKIRWSTEGRTVSRRNYDSDRIMIVDGKHQPIIDIDTWDAVQNRFAEQKKAYGKYQRPEQATEWPYKGLLRCSSCGATLIRLSNKYSSVQCHRYAKGQCSTSHNIALYKVNNAVIDYLEKCATAQTDFEITPQEQFSVDATPGINYTVLINAENKKLKRCKEAYQNGVDTLDEYKSNKAEILDTISRLETERDIGAAQKHNAIDKELFRTRISSVLDTLKNDEQSAAAKNAALRSIINKIVYNKAEGTFDVFFYI